MPGENYSDKGGKDHPFSHCPMSVKLTVREQLCSFHCMLSCFSPGKKKGKPQMLYFPQNPQQCAIVFKNHQIIQLHA